MQEISLLLNLEEVSRHPEVLMRNRSGELYFRNHSAHFLPKAGYHNDWNGWVKVRTTPIHQKCILHKSNVIQELQGDVLLLQEVESQGSFRDFLKTQLPLLKYQDGFSLDSNEDLGKGMGVAVRPGYTITSITTYRACKDHQGKGLFGKDVQKIRVVTDQGFSFILLHVFFDEDTDDKEASDMRRFQQALFVAKLYKKLLSEEKTHVVVAGCLAAPGFCHSLEPLLRKTTLTSIAKHPKFVKSIDLDAEPSYMRMELRKQGIALQQKDFILLSPELYGRVKSCGLSKKGMYPGKSGHWNCYPTLKSTAESASEHPALWVDLGL
ncbi:endonuclease/exonuclease/phosphatase family protein [Robertkochia marina]|nr:endonuclease/exonuclease/phosphatase family protein [Robertkochia marina]